MFGASDFPLAFSTAGGDTAAALAAGCPVVFKAHSGHMATAELVAQAIGRAAEQTGMPAGVFNMVYGGGVGEWLVKHPAIQAVGFTGWLKGGRALCDMAAARPQPIPVFAEMSSINPVLMLPAALAARGEKIARELADSVVQGCGQFCTDPGLVIGIASPAFSLFVANLIAEIGQRPRADHARTPAPWAAYERGLAALHAHPGAEAPEPAGRRKAARPARSCSRPMSSLLLNGDEAAVPGRGCSARSPWWWKRRHHHAGIAGLKHNLCRLSHQRFSPSAPVRRGFFCPRESPPSLRERAGVRVFPAPRSCRLWPG